MSLINYGKQFLDNTDISNVKKVLKSNFLTQGSEVEKFEAQLKKKLKAKYCSAVSSGTAALHLLGLALGWKKNDVVITTPLSFVATSNSILYAGAQPVFVDIDYKSGNLCPNNLNEKIKELKKKKKRIKAVIAIDYGGCPSEWRKLRSITKKNKILLINDGCHGLGAKINKNFAYAIKYADFVTYSFHPVKPITTGEGGAILTNDKFINDKIKKLRSHGITKNIKKYLWHNDMQELGYNYRITDFQCALGSSQLRKINKFTKGRKLIALFYNKKLKNLSNIECPEIPSNCESAYHLYPLKINFGKIRLKKNNFFKKLIKKGIKLQVHYIPIYRHSYYKKKFNLNFQIQKNFIIMWFLYQFITI
jgi:UDP-4-amino-4,6-dideoxy-L-N-acetyl-beta-L-altrosamine transaminase